MDDATVENLKNDSVIDCFKCLCNIQIMEPSCREMFVKTGCTNLLVPALKVNQFHKVDDLPIESLFLILRLCFLASATDTKVAQNFVEQGILDALAQVFFY